MKWPPTITDTELQARAFLITGIKSPLLAASDSSRASTAAAKSYELKRWSRGTIARGTRRGSASGVGFWSNSVGREDPASRGTLLVDPRVWRRSLADRSSTAHCPTIAAFWCDPRKAEQLALASALAAKRAAQHMLWATLPWSGSRPRAMEKMADFGCQGRCQGRGKASQLG
jgi:hypothetical protein